MAKVLVSKRAIIQRIQRALKQKGQDLRISRADKCKLLGKFYTVGDRGVVQKKVDLRKLAVELKRLEPWEALED
jgi:hypothetical protein